MTTYELKPGEWTEISDSSCKYQVITNSPIYTYEGTEAPDNEDNVFVAPPAEMMLYTSNNDKLFAYSPYNTSKITVKKQ